MILLLIFNHIIAFSQFKNEKVLLTKNDLVRAKEFLKKYHPNPFFQMGETAFDATIDSIAHLLPKDSILMTEVFYQYRRAFDKITCTDPHFRMIPQLAYVDGKYVKSKDISVLPFSLLQINDTLIVDKAFGDKIQAGDRIISINNVDSKTLLKYAYKDRYIHSGILQVQNHHFFNKEYAVAINRNGTEKVLELNGIPSSKYKGEFSLNRVDYSIIDNVGYIEIKAFDFNKFIIKQINKLIDKIQKNGIDRMIIDIRRNTGGNGNDFDRLMSVFTSREKLPYQREVRIKCSAETKDYNFPKKEMGEIYTLPDDKFYSEIPLHPKLYRGPIKYYVLISKNTSSMAATFANIMQYNNLGILVGEDLSKNALRFGEVTKASFKESGALVISTAEIDEYTKAKDGIIRPDIRIPYVAKEYMQGGDPMLEKLLKIIDTNNNGKTNQE